MKNSLSKIIGGIGFIISVALLIFIGVREAKPVGASVAISGEYQATSTEQMTGFMVPSTVRSQRLIKTAYDADSNRLGQSVTLGSITIASTTNASIRIWNATSTTDSASTTPLFTLATSTAAGTYTFDLILTRGLIIDYPIGFAGSYVITYR